MQIPHDDDHDDSLVKRADRKRDSTAASNLTEGNILYSPEGDRYRVEDSQFNVFSNFFDNTLSQLGDMSYENSLQQREGGDQSATYTYDAMKVIGHGSFGCVFLAKVLETNEVVAIKKVLQNRKFKNRELQIMNSISIKNAHPFIIQLKHSFLSTGKEKDGDRRDIYLNLVLEYMPETMHSMAKQYAKQRQSVPIEYVRVYMFQLARALAHIHGLGICHRDIKPQNLLIDPSRFVLKLCDFGSSKILIRGEPNVAYICSRYYRAPELIFGSNDYTTIIDMWSYGCVVAELLLGAPIFPGNTGVDQLVEIIKALGAPCKEDLRSMNPQYQEFSFPNIRAHSFKSIFNESTDDDAIAVVESLLKYIPERRASAIEIVAKPFFLTTMISPEYRLPDGSPVPSYFFHFTREEKHAAVARGVNHQDVITQSVTLDEKISVNIVIDSDKAEKEVDTMNAAVAIEN